MEAVKMMEASSMKSGFVNLSIAVLDKVDKPKNKILGRLKDQMQSLSLSGTATGYSRMHNRHNRS